MVATMVWVLNYLLLYFNFNIIIEYLGTCTGIDTPTNPLELMRPLDIDKHITNML